MAELRLQTPRWALPLLQPSRYKGAHGGRGSGKSHFFGEMLIERQIMEKTDAVCVREIQKSLDQSVKKLLEGKIASMNAGAYFDVQDSRIKAVNGSLTIFQGMQNHTADSIKSLEGYDVAWVEEAQSLSQRSLDLLRPTLRKKGSELWFSWNPNKPTDPVDVLLRCAEPPPGSTVVEVNYRDNPWLPDELKTELEYDLSRDPDKFAHIWLGQYQQNSEARVFRNWKVEEFDVPEEAILRQGADWGYSVDPTVMVQCYIVGKNLYVPYEAYRVGCEIVDTPALFMSIPDAEKWPLTADSARPETISHMRKNGFPKINAAVKGARSLEEGVEWLKSFNIIVHPRCQHLIDELTLYSYKTDPLTGLVLPVLADKDNHCIAEGGLVLSEGGWRPIETIKASEYVMTRQGLRRVMFAGVTDVDRESLLIETTVGVLHCTPDHKVFTNDGLVRADALRYGDQLIGDSSWSKLSSTGARLIAATRKAIGRLIATITGEAIEAAQFSFIDGSGQIITAPFQTDARSTTRTRTQETTTSTISNVSRPESTSNSTPSVRSSVFRRLLTWMLSGISPKNGTPVTKDEQSTGRLARWLKPLMYRLTSRVFSAAVSSLRARLGTLISSAATNASPLTAAHQGLTTSSDSASSAEANSRPTSTAKSKPVAVSVVGVKPGPRVARVYDLTVEGEHEFYCEGVLVSNCVDALRYACEGARRAANTPKTPVVVPMPSHNPYARR